jgi:hypothetical protein
MKRETTGVPLRTIYDRIKRIPDRVVKCIPIKGFQLSPKERREVDEEVDE